MPLVARGKHNPGCRCQSEALTRELEIDPHKYYPPNVYRQPLTKLPNPQLVDLIEMAKVMGIDMSQFKK